MVKVKVDIVLVWRFWVFCVFYFDIMYFVRGIGRFD